MKTAEVKNAYLDLQSGLVLSDSRLQGPLRARLDYGFYVYSPSRLTKVCLCRNLRRLGTLADVRAYRRTQLRGQPIILRPMISDDTDKLLRFANQLGSDKRRGKYAELFTGFEQKMTRREEAQWLASQLVQIRSHDLVSVLAETGERIVANGEVSRGHYEETRHHGRLALAVLAGYRGLGIGREIVKILLREARKIGLKNVEVEFLATNQAAVHTYQKAGFVEVGTIPGKVQRSGRLIDSMIMARRL